MTNYVILVRNMPTDDTTSSEEVNTWKIKLETDTPHIIGPEVRKLRAQGYEVKVGHLV